MTHFNHYSNHETTIHQRTGCQRFVNMCVCLRERTCHQSYRCYPRGTHIPNKQWWRFEPVTLQPQYHRLNVPTGKYIIDSNECNFDSTLDLYSKFCIFMLALWVFLFVYFFRTEMPNIVQKYSQFMNAHDTPERIHLASFVLNMSYASSHVNLSIYTHTKC